MKWFAAAFAFLLALSLAPQAALAGAPELDAKVRTDLDAFAQNAKTARDAAEDAVKRGKHKQLPEGEAERAALGASLDKALLLAKDNQDALKALGIKEVVKDKAFKEGSKSLTKAALAVAKAQKLLKKK